jgi:hypothetical protein
MTDTLAVDIKAQLSWLHEDVLPLSTITDAAKLSYSRGLADGVEEGQADVLWHDQRTLAASAAEDLDLAALDSTAFGSPVAVGFAKVKALMVINLATVAGEDLLVGGAGAGNDAWSAPLDGDADAKIVVPADSALLLVNRMSGWDVESGVSQFLRIASAGAGSIDYKIAIVGASS